MFEIVLLNEKNKKFKKTFTSYFLYNKFLQKAKHSKKLTILFYGKI